MTHTRGDNDTHTGTGHFDKQGVTMTHIRGPNIIGSSDLVSLLTAARASWGSISSSLLLSAPSPVPPAVARELVGGVIPSVS